MTSAANIASPRTPEPPGSLAMLWTLLRGLFVLMRNPAGSAAFGAAIANLHRQMALAMKQRLLRHPAFAHLSSDDFDVRVIARGARIGFDVVDRDGRSLFRDSAADRQPADHGHVRRHNLRMAREWVRYRRIMWRTGSIKGLASGLPWGLPRARLIPSATHRETTDSRSGATTRPAARGPP